MRLHPFLCSAMCLVACGGDAAPPGQPSVAVPFDAATLLDSTIVPAVAGVDGWGYAVTSEADLTGDGVAERAVLTARVEMYRGRPAWDDGQPWQAYVEFADGTRRHLYAQRLQLGTLALRVSLPESEGPASLILIEHLPDRLRIFEAAFDAAGQPTVEQLLERRLDPVGQAAAPLLP